MDTKNNVITFPDKDHEFSVMNIRYVSDELTDYDRAFSGFDILEVVTFSYDLGFIQEIADKFKKIIIILGCEALVRNDAFTMVLEAQKHIIKEFTRYKKLRERVRDGSVIFKIVHSTIAHEKLFIMSNENDDHTRILSGSANFTRRGFSGPGVQRETVFCCEDDPMAYDYIHAEFDALFMECADYTPEKTLVSSENGTLKDEDVPVAENMVVHNVNFFLEKTDFDNEWNEAAFLTNIMDNARETEKYYPRITDKTKRREITPKHISTAVRKRKEDEISLQASARKYSTLDVDYATGQVLFDGKPYNMVSADMEKVKNDLTVMGRFFDGYDEFKYTGSETPDDMKRTYFKLMNFMLLSPFIAALRSTAHFNDYPEEYFPYYALVRGECNAGKTIFVRTVQKLMTGQNIPVLPASYFKRDDMTGLMSVIKGMPMCLDDMTGDQFKQADNIVKNDVILYDERFIRHGTFIITSNNIKDPKKAVAKRMFVLTVSGTQDIPDATSKRRTVNALLKGLSTEFYSEYLRRMLPEVNEMIYRMQTDDSDEDWVPDIFRISSETVLSIYKECSLPVPSYVEPLFFDDYFGDESLCANSKKIISDAWRYTPEAFNVRRSSNILEYTAGEYSSKAEELMRILPRSLEARQIDRKVIMRLDKAQEFFGIDFKKRRFKR